MGRRLVEVDRSLLASLLVTDVEHHLRVTAGLPEGATLLGATFRGERLVLTFDHPAWPESSETVVITIKNLQGEG